MFEIDKQKFGSFIAGLRREKGYTQRELAEKLFVSDKAVSKWETGQSMPDISLLRPLAEILGVTATELLEGERISPDTAMEARRTDELLQKVIRFSEEEQRTVLRRRKKNGAAYVICMILGIVETVVYLKVSGEAPWVVTGPSSINFSNVITIELLCGIFGAYFCFFAKEKLPAYYDENRINGYVDGAFRINLPGVRFNNSNWPYILRSARLWCMITVAVFPLIYLTVFFLFGDRWNNVTAGVMTAVTLIVALGGLFIPMYAAAKKYE